MDGIITLVLTSTKEIMRAHKELYGQGVKIKISPMPDDISHDCGVVIQARESDLEKIDSIMGRLSVGDYTLYKNESGHYQVLTTGE